jgi:hypothetical protein
MPRSDSSRSLARSGVVSFGERPSESSQGKTEGIGPSFESTTNSERTCWYRAVSPRGTMATVHGKRLPWMYPCLCMTECTVEKKTCTVNGNGLVLMRPEGVAIVGEKLHHATNARITTLGRVR